MINRSHFIFIFVFINSAQESSPPLLYDYGPATEDLTLPRNDDGFVGPLGIPISFHYFNNVFDSVFVNTNGVISFGNGVPQHTPDPFPSSNGHMLIAVFWADVDTRHGGNIYYRSTNNMTLLARLTSDLQSYFGDVSDFQAEWAFVVTWENVTYYGGSPTTPTNTFKAVLVADGTSTFAIFTYDTITWTTGTRSGGDSVTGLEGTPAQVGFSAGDGQNYLAVPGSRTNSIVNIASTSNVGVPGKYVFKLDGGVTQPCGHNANRYIQPRAGSFLGGRQVRVTGICLSPSDNIKCEFNGIMVPGRYIGSSEAECITPVSSARGRVRVRVSRDGGTSYVDFPPFTYFEIDPLYHAVHENEEDWETGSWAGSATVTYNPADLSGVSSVNLDYVAIGPGNPAQLKLTRLVIGASNNGRIRLPSRLNQENIAISAYGAMRVTPLSNDGRIIWTRPEISLWYLKLIFSELATRETQSQQQPTLEIFPTPPVSLNIGTSQILQAVRTFIQSTNNQFNVVTFVLSRVSGNICLWFYNEDRKNPTSYSDSISPPCTLRQALADGRFELDGTCHQNAAVNRMQCDFFHQDVANCVRTRTPRSGRGQQACYSSAGILLPYHQGGGTVEKYHPRAHPLLHVFQDVFARLFCCKFSSNCDKYGEMRPTRSCDDYTPPDTAGGWGDSHIISLDGLFYTFNAVGEFIVLQSSVNGLQVQGRMTRMVDPQGNILDASVWNAFALKTSASDTVQVESNYNTFRVLVNGVLEDFAALPTQQFMGVDVTQTSSTEVIIHFNQAGQEVSLKISILQGMMNFVLSLSNSYQGTTSGLHGNNDGNPDNDLRRRDGEVLPPMTKSLTLYDALLTWRTTAAESIFTYGDRASHEIYQNEDFQPNFPTVDDILNNPQASVCSGDLACLYDLSVTNDPSFASRTRTAGRHVQRAITAFGTVRSCGTPSDVPDGNVAYSGTTQHSRAYYSCNQNYQLNGNSTATCHADGLWSQPPKCSQNLVASGTKLQVFTTLPTVLFIVIGMIS